MSIGSGMDYLYEAGDIESIRRMLSFYLQHNKPISYDIALLPQANVWVLLKMHRQVLLDDGIFEQGVLSSRRVRDLQRRVPFGECEECSDFEEPVAYQQSSRRNC